MLCVFLPFLGVLVYVSTRGRHMGSREAARARARQEEFDTYIRDTAAGGRSSVDELARLAGIRDRGGLSDEEFRRAKELVLAGRDAAGGTDGAPGTGASAS